MVFEDQSINSVAKSLNKEIRIYIGYDDKKKRYLFESRESDKYFDLSNIVKLKKGSNYKGILDFLNKTQSVRIIPEESQVVYASGGFYSIFTELGKKLKWEELHISNILFPSKKLEGDISEKGSSGFVGNDWEDGCLFHLIDNLGHNDNDLKKHFLFPDEPTLIVCDDIGKEIADFIFVNENMNGNSRVVFVHAKCQSKKHASKLSASKLQDVCGQAIKNIHYLSMFNVAVPINDWDKKWKLDKSQPTTHKTRIRKPANTKKAEAWKKINAAISNPLTQKEVWIMAGNIFSKSEFKKELKKTKPARL
ncbi:hypothetical protein [Pontibacter pudoricolor]|uniref:hypothetical protein n=1 Tax=Pontibacter pudoricolor TaxID=2694930 RepID=UPI001391B015|nr:hypothetical protein [Pontibacter pudoricolor]